MPKTQPHSSGPPIVLAWIENHPKSVIVLRAARRRAQKMGCKWRVVYIETPKMRVDDGSGEPMLRLLTLAGQMGGEVIHMESDNVEEGFRKLLETEKEPIALCVIGTDESEGDGWRRNWRRSSWQRICHLAREYTEVETVPLTGQPFTRSWLTLPRIPDVRLIHIGYAFMSVAVAFLCAVLLQLWLPPELLIPNNQNIALLFMIACAFTAGRYGLIPGLWASIASFITMNYFFTPPFYEIQASSVTDVLNMGLFLAAAVLISLFHSHTRAQAERADRRELSTQVLFTLYRIAANSFSRQQALEKLQRRLSHMLQMGVAFFLPPMLNPDRIETAFPPNLKLDENDRKALETCWSEIKATGRASPFNPGTNWRFEPMIASSGEIGVLGVRLRKDEWLDPWYGGLLAAVADQTAAVLEHLELERSMEASRIREEREKLRSMLLSSVSHDLKTPLSGIIGALSVHQSLGSRLTPERQQDLLETALEEAYRLDSFITNILDMTRLESGKTEFRQEWHDVPSLVHQVIKRLQHRLRHHALVVEPFPIGTEVFMDVMMTEQVLSNVLDNACKYTPAGTRIEISFHAGEEGFFLQVHDYGKGLPADKLLHVFDKYARLKKEDMQVAGTGLGLSICKAIMEAQDGSITASNHPEGGAVFTLFLPKWRRLAQAKRSVA